MIERVYFFSRQNLGALLSVALWSEKCGKYSFLQRYLARKI